MQYTYVLLSEQDGRFYTGSSGDLRARFRDHNAGRVHSTAYRRPLKLLYNEACLDAADACRRERFLKTGKGKRYLNNRLKQSLQMLRANKLERH
ncbi:MAG: excinuclease ABC subunit C [Gemmatimonadetes bacterium 13_1_40CM_4_69_8]|nr:MAG: excinuclease ABC subunit C [Gemmatimonadetes bacterium 13_1_40CM_4_69_8]